MNRQKKTIYLHVGTTKTGSTSIQAFLEKNEMQLREQGVSIYTPYLARDGCDQKRMRCLLNYLENPSVQENREWLKRFLRGLREDPSDTLILSEECLWDIISSVCRRDGFKSVIQQLVSWADVKIIVYLRRQDLYLMSLYQQCLKAEKMWGKTCLQWLPVGRAENLRCDYKRVLQWLFPLVGPQNVIVRAFEPSQFLEQALLADFLDGVGLRLTDRFETSSEVFNVGMSPFFAEILRCLSFYDCDQQLMSQLKHFRAQDFGCYFKKKQAHRFLSPTVRCQLMRAYEKGNRWVARELMGRDDGVLFRDPLPAMNEPWREYRLRPHDVKRFFAEVDALTGIERKKMCNQVLFIVRKERCKRLAMCCGYGVVKQKMYEIARECSKLIAVRGPRR